MTCGEICETAHGKESMQIDRFAEASCWILIRVHTCFSSISSTIGGGGKKNMLGLWKDDGAMREKDVLLEIIKHEQRQTFRNRANQCFLFVAALWGPQGLLPAAGSAVLAVLCWRARSAFASVPGHETGQAVDPEFSHTAFPNRECGRAGSQKRLSAFLTSELQHHPVTRVCMNARALEVTAGKAISVSLIV